MASRKSKNIEEIDDILNMAQVLKALGLSSGGYQTLDAMKTRVKTVLNQSAEKPCWKAGQVRILRVE